MAGIFSQATLEQIRAASDIVDVIGSYLPLKRAGANFVALCPFHKEKTPSFNVNPHKQIFHCFGCHKGGDVFTFVKEYESLDFPEAVRRLAERARIPLEFEQGAAGQESRNLKENLLQIHEQIAQRWQNALANEAGGQVARDYLARRGVSAEAVALFRLGCAPEAWDDTVNWAKSKGYETALMEKAGLILRKEGTDRYYDRFRGRLMFPICDEQGRVIGFSGRVLSGDEKTAKYVNSPETPIFTKSKVFFGLDKSKRALLETGYAIVCEGQLDLIACFMAGVQNMVAPQGTAFTADHARILKRYVEEVVLCFDSDEAGQNAAVRALDHLLASGLAVRVAVVPPPHDPDSFIKASGGPAFKQLIERAEGFFDYYLGRLCAINETTTDKGRLAVLRGMAEAVHKTANGVLIDTYAQKTALRLGVSPEAVRDEFRKLAARSSATSVESEAEEEEAASAQPQPMTPQEFCLLKFLFETDEHTDWVAAHLKLEWLTAQALREIVAARLRSHTAGTWQGVGAFLSSFEDDASRQIITEVLTRPLVTNTDGLRIPRQQTLPNVFRQLQDVLRDLRNDFLDRQMAALTQQASQPEMRDEDRLTILRQQQELRALKRQPLPPA
jgi:DNA primase